VGRRRRVSGRTDESSVLVLGDREAADIELANIDAVDGTLVLVNIGSAHQVLAGGNPGQIRLGDGESFFTHESSPRAQYSV
jgi:hypothetical protein